VAAAEALLLVLVVAADVAMHERMVELGLDSPMSDERLKWIEEAQKEPDRNTTAVDIADYADVRQLALLATAPRSTPTTGCGSGCPTTSSAASTRTTTTSSPVRSSTRRSPRTTSSPGSAHPPSAGVTVAFLSDDWFALGVSEGARLEPVPGATIRLQQVVTGAPVATSAT